VDVEKKNQTKSLLRRSPNGVRGVKEDSRFVGDLGLEGLSECDERDRVVTEVDWCLVRTESLSVLPSRLSWRALFASLRVS
jgi:hypothetical protein